MRLRWSLRSIRNIDRLRLFLEPKDTEAAARAVSTIVTGAGLLLSTPHIGRPVPALGAGVREWRIRFGQSGYIVLYRADEREVVILAVRHEREAGYRI